MRIVAGTARSRTIRAPEGKDTRPTLDRVRENLFNIIQWVIPGARVLDLFAGSGALALEALSRGASTAVLVDKDPRAARVERANVESLGFTSRAKVLCADWPDALYRLARENQAFDLVFLDPPYALMDHSVVFASLRQYSLLHRSALVVLEHRADTPPLVDDGFSLTDERRYGIVGIQMYRMREGE